MPVAAAAARCCVRVSDTQVNGGAGVLFNAEPTVDAIREIGRAHRQFGTTGFLPTLISDDLHVVARALEAVAAAIAAGVPGVLGIHIEGPFLNVARKGVHDSGKLRGLDEGAIGLLTSLREADASQCDGMKTLDIARNWRRRASLCLPAIPTPPMEIGVALQHGLRVSRNCSSDRNSPGASRASSGPR